MVLLQPLAPMPAPAPAQAVWVVSAQRQLGPAPQTVDGGRGLLDRVEAPAF